MPHTDPKLDPVSCLSNFPWLSATSGGAVQGSNPLGVPQPLCSDLEDAVINAFSFLLQNLAYEIILTLGQAFEVAYQLALQARKGGHSSTLPESFENKPSKPIPKPRVSIRKSVVSRKDRCSENLELEGRDPWCRWGWRESRACPSCPSLGLILACVCPPLSPVPAKSWGPSA